MHTTNRILAGTLAFALAGPAHAADAKTPPQDTTPRIDSSSCPKPQWPRASLRNEESGTVTLAFLVGEDGAVREGRIERSSGFRDLDRAAFDAMLKCRMFPAIVNGKPAQGWARMQYVWTLEGTPSLYHQLFPLTAGLLLIGDWNDQDEAESEE